MIIDCIKIREKYIEKLNKRDLSKVCCLFIQVGNNQASNTYVNNKIKLCNKLNIKANHMHLPESITEEDLLDIIKEANDDADITGIMVQLPLPQHISEEKVINTIHPSKDIDGFTNENKGKLINGDNSAIVPCTPNGIMTVLEELDVDLNGKNVVVVGRSNIVGKPIAQLLINKGATVTVCNSKTDKILLKNLISNCHIFISAIGQANYFNKDFFRGYITSYFKNMIAIDVGINRDKNNKLCGDIDKKMYECFGYITPVPGGVGILTVLNVILNSIKCCENNKEG
ncbi:TPA: bifunctional 5,10-methylenetetrahydrofolate dehydrogenase/5,10-methenyltetrahydrofolate cyclohydrolase [Clostridium perfringens]